MMSLLMFKKRLKTFYGKYDMYLISIIKCVTSFLAFYLLNKNIGSMPILKNPVIPIVLALLCSFMPYGIIVVIAAGFMLLHLFSISIEIALVTAVLLILVGILYYSQQPGDSFLLLVVPLLFAFRIPYAVPLVAGLSLGIASIVPMGCGICIYYILLYVKENTGLITNGAQAEALQKYSQAVDAVLNNKVMLVMLVAFVVSMILVNIIRRLPVNYSWMIAIVVGIITQISIIFLGSMRMNITLRMGTVLLGILASALIAVVYHFFVFTVDYSRIEHVQYEDDEYYYYVKAVPKMMVTEPDVRVHKINDAKRQSRGMQEREENSQ